MLAEALVAASILATALLALGQVLALAASANVSAGRLTQATAIAAQKIEDLRASSATALDGSGGDAPAPGVTREWTVGALASDPDHVAIIDVVVRTRGSTTRLVALRTTELP